jgi:hypothetical protein
MATKLTYSLYGISAFGCMGHIRPGFPFRYRTLKIFASSSSLAVSYAVSVRRASVLLAASSGFHLAVDTLAVRLTIPPARFVEDFHLQVSAPCRAHKGKPRLLTSTGARYFARPRLIKNWQVLKAPAAMMPA